MRVIERKIRLDGTTDDFLCDVLLMEPGRRAVLRYVLDRDWLVADTQHVPKGSVTISHYWADRPYNVYHWIAADGATIAYYFNVVGRTEIRDDLVSYEDLVVDVLVKPSGDATVLDEEDLPPDLSPERRRIVARALETIASAPLRLVREVEAASRPHLAAAT